MKPEAGSRKTEDRGPKTEMRNPSRRDILKAAAIAPLAFVPFSHADAALAAAHAMEALQGQAGGVAYVPKFFHADEWKELRVLVNLIIPKDERSGSATDAGVPEFMDFICIAYPDRQASMRDGLRWLDALAYDTYHKNFANCSDAEHRAMLDQIAWPGKAAPEMREGVQYFNRIRDFTASGFFSSQMGVKDIGYIGNAALPAWHGCPKPALDHIGVRYS
ncbi:MAG: gluconate 2-dehydrogenase subunit 3 family protein [Gemmatimonadaceae bacterium]